jgi:hypothetical protein
MNVAGFQRAFDDAVVIVGAADLKAGFLKLLNRLGELVLKFPFEDHSYVTYFGVAWHGRIVLGDIESMHR